MRNVFLFEEGQCKRKLTGSSESNSFSRSCLNEFSSFFVASLTNEHEDQCTNDHDDGLDEIGPDNSGEAAEDGEEGRQGQEDEDAEVKAAEAGKAKGQFDKQGASVEISLKKNISFYY